MKAVVSPLPDTISTKFQRLYLFLRSGNSLELLGILCYQTGSGKCKMAATKFQMHENACINEIPTALHPCFGVQYSNGTSADAVQPNRKWIIQDGGHLTSNACISARRQDRYEILTASATTPTFWGSSNPLELVEILCDQTGSGKSKMAATILQMHVSPLPDKISTKFQLLAVFGIQHSIGT